MNDRRAEIWARILEGVTTSPGPLETPCWLWNGTHSGKGRGGGYPRMKLGGQTVAVHRVAATHVYGFVPGKKQLDHLCRNRMCVNPHHMEIVSHKVNQERRDMARRGACQAQIDPGSAFDRPHGCMADSKSQIERSEAQVDGGVVDAFDRTPCAGVMADSKSHVERSEAQDLEQKG